MVNKTDVERVPKLRFARFEGEWDSLKLEDVTQKIKDGTHFSPKLYESGRFKYITSRNIRNGYMDLRNVPFLSDEAHEDIFKRCDVQYNDVLITKDGACTGNVCLNELVEEFSLLSSVAFIRANKSKADNGYIYQYICCSKGQREVRAAIAGQAITRITLTKLRNFKFCYPTLPEQQIIASFLSEVDQKIQQLTRKKELLEQYKRGVMQKIFSREIRFKDENGNDYPDWEEKRLGEVCKFLDAKRIPISEAERLHKKGHYPYYGASGIIDYVDDYIFDGEYVLLGEDGANILNRSTPLAFTVSGKIWVNNHAHVMEAYGSTQFLAESLERIRYEKYNTGTAQPKLNAKICKNIPIVLPTHSEQQKIASFLSTIDKKIESVKTQLTQTQQFKKGLLQQIFI
jgi:type I restriction enzyme S subunit